MSQKASGSKGMREWRRRRAEEEREGGCLRSRYDHNKFATIFMKGEGEEEGRWVRKRGNRGVGKGGEGRGNLGEESEWLLLWPFVWGLRGWLFGLLFLTILLLVLDISGNNFFFNVKNCWNKIEENYYFFYLVIKKK